MKVILLDDEILALNYLEHQLKKNADVEIIGKFVDPTAVKECLRNQDADVVFMDIHLPDMSGVELAEQILENKPKLNIVFVTGHDDYAIKAFELNAIDYLMKPVGTERLLKTIQRIQERLGESSDDDVSLKKSTIQLKMFQHLLIESGDNLFTTIRWRTTKAQELFLYLLQHRGQLIRKSALIDILWPELEASKANSQLYTAVYHIRKTIEPFGDRFQISNAADGYILNMKKVRLDVEEWENYFVSGLPISGETIHDYENFIDLYKGDYLREYEYWWVESERHRLKMLWLRVTFQMAEWYFLCGQNEKAIEKYLEICNRHPQAEEGHFALMKIYAAMNRHLSVHRQYRLLTTMLTEELNEKPSSYINEWYHRWNQVNKE